jgi:hypothetical protein
MAHITRTADDADDVTLIALGCRYCRRVPTSRTSDEAIMSYPPVGPPPAESSFAAGNHPGASAPSPFPSTLPPPPGHAPAAFGTPPYGPMYRLAAFPRRAGAWQGIVASATVILVVLAHFWEISRVSHQVALIDDIHAGRAVTLAQAQASDNALSDSLLVFLLMSVIATVFVMVWAYHARVNAAAYTTSPFRRSKGWAIGGWICPVVALWFPYQVVKDIWAASDTDRPDNYAIKAWPVTVIVPLWWTCLIGGRIVERLSVSVYPDDVSSGSTDSFHTALVLDYASAAADIAAAIMFILIIAAVTRFQAQRYDNALAAALPAA